MSKEIIETLQPAAKKRHISISYQGKRLSISGMPQIIYEMLYNVCDNAIHYNKDEGTVVITTEKTEEGICWSVADTGIGIPLAEQERIFERFYRVDKSHSRATRRHGSWTFHCKARRRITWSECPCGLRPGSGNHDHHRIPCLNLFLSVVAFLVDHGAHTLAQFIAIFTALEALDTEQGTFLCSR